MFRQTPLWLLVVLGCAMAVPPLRAQQEAPAEQKAPAQQRTDSPWKLVRNVVYAERPSGELKADLFLQQAPGPHPAVVCIHGGAWRSGVKEQLHFIARRLADEGFVVMCIQYRLAPKHKFPAQVEDCQAAVAWLRKHAARYGVDRDWIAAWGYSAGGHLAALLALSAQGDRTWESELGGQADTGPAQSRKKAPPPWRLQAAVAGGTPADLHTFGDGLAFWLGATPQQNPRVYDLASPRWWVSADDPPVLFYHGTKDLLVRVEQVRDTVADLKKVGAPVQLLEMPERGHIGAALDPRGIRAGLAFLKQQYRRFRQGD